MKKWRVTVWNGIAGYRFAGDGRTKIKAMDAALKNARDNGIIVSYTGRIVLWAHFYQAVGNIVVHGYSSYSLSGTPTLELRKL